MAQSLPKERHIIMKLLYYDEYTPSDYEPPHFRPVAPEETLSFQLEPEKMDVGQLDTPYHS